jgi:hypothetical protein
LNQRIFVKISTKNLFLAAILMPLLALIPVAYAQNNETSFINKETLNQAPDALKSAYNEAKNTSMGLVDQAPDALKSAYNESKNTSM